MVVEREGGGDYDKKGLVENLFKKQPFFRVPYK